MTSNLLGDNKAMQIGLVVENIDEAAQAWAHLLGVKLPSIIVTDPVNIAHTRYQGNSTPAQAKLAFFDLGQVSLEIVPVIRIQSLVSMFVRH